MTTITKPIHEVAPARLQAPGAVAHKDRTPMSTQHRTDASDRTTIDLTLQERQHLTYLVSDRVLHEPAERLTDDPYRLTSGDVHQLADGVEMLVEITQNCLTESNTAHIRQLLIDDATARLTPGHFTPDGGDPRPQTELNAWMDLERKFGVDRRIIAADLGLEEHPSFVGRFLVRRDDSQMLDVSRFRQDQANDMAPRDRFWSDIACVCDAHDGPGLDATAAMLRDSIRDAARSRVPAS